MTASATHAHVNANERHEYTANVAWTGGRHGPTSSYQSYSREYEFHVGAKPVMRGSADPHFRGDSSLYNPEELLVVALSTCHLLSYLAACARTGIHVLSYEDDATGIMSVRAEVLCFAEVVLHPRVVVAAGTDVERAAALHERAHHECFIANSVNFPVRHEADIRLAAPA